MSKIIKFLVSFRNNFRVVTYEISVVTYPSTQPDAYLCWPCVRKGKELMEKKGTLENRPQIS